MHTLITIFLVLLISYDAKSSEIEDPPYGIRFGQKFNASEHKTIQRRGNVRSVILKTANRPDDTEELRAEICDDYGLQIITWRSHIRSLASASASHNEILKEFEKKYGAPRINRKSAFWTSSNFQIVVKIRSKNNTHQNQIRYFGPRNKPCFNKLIAHQQELERAPRKPK
ncbi:MAG TPA: hypothetical protein EYQ26_02525 [Rhodospirillales bacterium]|jgi:hypothetical protein|nr:hypothetical protein [Rhodospirillales bacterium]